ncbi:hypothetical protein TNCV_4600341 [Trichonephila clavipes]|nr:hypothetical protein TNCV_4600341 [Trichonephila clavipes]
MTLSHAPNRTIATAKNADIWRGRAYATRLPSEILKSRSKIAVAASCVLIENQYDLMLEGRIVPGTFRSERMRVLNRSRQNDRLRVMLVLVHIDITPPRK